MDFFMFHFDLLSVVTVICLVYWWSSAIKHWYTKQKAIKQLEDAILGSRIHEQT